MLLKQMMILNIFLWSRVGKLGGKPLKERVKKGISDPNLASGQGDRNYSDLCRRFFSSPQVGDSYLWRWFSQKANIGQSEKMELQSWLKVQSFCHSEVEDRVGNTWGLEAWAEPSGQLTPNRWPSALLLTLSGSLNSNPPLLAISSSPKEKTL